MNVIFLVTCTVAAFSCGLAASEMAISNGSASYLRSIISRQSRKPASRASCDIPALRSCLLTFFGNIGLSTSSLPSGPDFENQFRSRMIQDPPQSFQDTCRYFGPLIDCNSVLDCWTVDSLNQLNFPNGFADVTIVMTTLWKYLDICEDTSYKVLFNFECAFLTQKTQDQVNAAGCNTTVPTCANACNLDVGRIFCDAYQRFARLYLPNCTSADFLDVCIDATETVPPTINGTTSQMATTTTKSVPLCENPRFKSIAEDIFYSLTFNLNRPNIDVFRQEWSRKTKVRRGVTFLVGILEGFQSGLNYTSLDSCWSVNGLASGFASMSYSQTEAALFATTFWEYNYLFRSQLEVLTANVDCLYSDATNDKISQSKCNININNANAACSSVVTDLSCIKSAYSSACNATAGQLMCDAYLTAGIEFYPQCSAQIQNACKDQKSSSGPIDRVPSAVLTFVIALLLALLL